MDPTNPHLLHHRQRRSAQPLLHHAVPSSDGHPTESLTSPSAGHQGLHILPSYTRQKPVLPPQHHATTAHAGQPSSMRLGPLQLSTGAISSDHIRWVSELRSMRGRWSSEIQGCWTATEIDYFEFTYELFEAGLLDGIEVGLPVRYFMSELLG